jgi:hypothetical protein
MPRTGGRPSCFMTWPERQTEAELPSEQGLAWPRPEHFCPGDTKRSDDVTTDVVPDDLAERAFVCSAVRAGDPAGVEDIDE